MFCTVITLLLSEARVVTLEGCTRPLNIAFTTFFEPSLYGIEASYRWEKRKWHQIYLAFICGVRFHNVGAH